ncbi:MAG: DUF1295 domain-containing protein [Paludibacter sp.]|nr:DUF1295 domain-containing protein [Paludibacter sp.]
MTMNLILLIPFANEWHFLLTDETALGHLIRLWVSIMLCMAIVCFVTSQLTRNFSQVDKVWSLLPIVYSWITLLAVPSSPRLWIMTMLVTVWGIRLSYNFYRKGGYSILPWKGEEDYRWGILRQFPFFQKKGRFTLFNLLFISLYQNVVIFLFSTPLLLAAEYNSEILSETDILAAFFMALFILIETVADNQLYQFHKQKQNKIIQDSRFSGSLAKGFLSEGLWNYVRHPNYLSEQLIWVTFYFFGVSASGRLINWTLPGPLLLILIFIGSSKLTEQISCGKYPEYRLYMQKVPKFIPTIFKIKKQEK